MKSSSGSSVSLASCLACPSRVGAAGSARLTSLSGTHCGSSREKGLLKAPFSGTMRRPLGLRTSFFPSGSADMSLRRCLCCCCADCSWTRPLRWLPGYLTNQSKGWSHALCADWQGIQLIRARGGVTPPEVTDRVGSQWGGGTSSEVMDRPLNESEPRVEDT